MSGCLDFYEQITILWKKCVLCKKCSRIAAEFHCFFKEDFLGFWSGFRWLQKFTLEAHQHTTRNPAWYLIPDWRAAKPFIGWPIVWVGELHFILLIKQWPSHLKNTNFFAPRISIVRCWRSLNFYWGNRTIRTYIYFPARNKNGKAKVSSLHTVTARL